jgi:8-oxo-dGTP pyrophosphatase MutT (NUDIX family)
VPGPYLVPVDLLLLYTRRGERGMELLVGLRCGGFAAGEWDSPSGKLVPGETLDVGMVREAFEETGLQLAPDELEFVAVTHWHPPDGPPRIGMFFHCAADPARHGTPTVLEPDKCVRQVWAPIGDLPQPLLRYTQIGVELFRTGRRYAAVDWPAPGGRP